MPVVEFCKILILQIAISDGAGNSLASARDLGTFTGGQTFKDRITRRDRQDYYKFTLDTTGKVNFGLTGLKANALYQDEVLVRNIASNTPSDGQANWTVPTNLPVSDRYKIKISQVGNDAIGDFSDNYFSIFRPEITLTSPNGGDKLTPSEDFNITWNDNIDEDVRIDLFVRSDTSSVQTITDKTPSDGNFIWNVPEDLPIDAEYKITVTSFTNPATTDTSDEYFSIEPEVILDNAWKAEYYNNISLSGIPVFTESLGDSADFNGDGHVQVKEAANKVRPYLPTQGLFA